MNIIVEAEKSFKELTGIKLNSSSQLNMFNILSDLVEDEYFMNIFRTYVLEDDVVNNNIYYTTHEVSATDFWDTISYQYYDTPNLWWVIALVNNIINPFEEPVAGQNIKILKRDYVQRVLKNIARVGRI